jgi:prefoldin subunit 5
MKKEKKIAIVGIIIILSISILSIIEFSVMSEAISELQQEKKFLENRVQDKMNELQNVNSQISSLNSQINQIQNSLNEAINELELLNSGNRYKLQDPTYSEALSFIRSDKTNIKPYDDDTFNCAHYAQEVNNNAEEQNMRCAYVLVNLSEGAHALVGFNTTDKGIIYFEPQNDYKVNLETGKDYWADCVVPPAGYYYEPDPTWIIEDFTVFW